MFGEAMLVLRDLAPHNIHDSELPNFPVISGNGELLLKVMKIRMQ